MNKLFCKNLKEARRAMGYTQREVAGFLNVVESCYANWEQGRTEPGTLDLGKLCKIFQVTSDYLLGLESQGDQENSATPAITRLTRQDKELFTEIRKLTRPNKIKLLGFILCLLELQGK